MATESPQSTSASADSYIGSSISLISKSEIRYEGVLFHINPLESTIGLKSVRSFGTEGRKKDGPQILPSDRVYDYIYFRGSDIKDLQVLPSVSVQNPPAIPNDPAIIQSHYSHPATSANLAQANTASMTNISSVSQLGLPGSVFQGSMPQFQPMGNTGSWVPSPLLNVNSSEPRMPVYLQGLKGPGGLSDLQQQPLLGQTPSALSPQLPLQQHMQSSMIDTSKPSGAINFPEAPPLLPPLYASTLNSTQKSIPISALASKIPFGGYATVASNEVPSQMANYEPSTFPALPSFTFLNPLTSAAHTDNTVAQVGSRTLSSISSTSPHHRLPLSSPSNVGTCNSNNVEVSTPSLVTPDQLLQSAAINSPMKASPPHLQTAQKDIEVVQASTPDLLQVELTKEAQISLTLDRKLNTAPVDSDSNHKGVERGRRNRGRGPSLRGHRGLRSRVGGRENNMNGAMSTSHQNNTSHARGRGRGLYGRNHHNYEDHGWRKEKYQMNGDASSRRYGNMSRTRGRTNRVSHFNTKFTGDFDFEAMNEKFNKAEVWGELGKTMKPPPEDHHVDTSDSDEEEHEDANGKSKLETKPVYVKDDFFDSLSSDAICHESQKKVKFHQQRKIDVETFGYFKTNRGRGGRGRGRGNLSRGGSNGRGGYERAGRGMWSRVT